MAQHSTAALARLAGFFLCGMAVLLLVGGPLVRTSTGQVETSPAAKLAELGMKFEGAKSCANANCHGKKGDDPPTEIGHEYTIWDSQDKHREAFEALSNDKSKAIGAAMKIKDVTADNSCLSCHALNVKKDLQGENFRLNDGNSCDNCHGPSEKWIKPHADKGWVQKQRDELKSHAAMLKQWGIYDTKPLAERATWCTGCHLAIDADMIAAGHPQPTFELSDFQSRQPRHWLANEQKYYVAKVWLAGQVASLRDAMNQLAMRASQKKSPEMVKTAYQQAMSHLTVLKSAGAAVGLDSAALDASATDLSKSIADPTANADAIAGKAAAISAMANTALGKVNSVAPDKAMTTQALGAIAANDGMSKDFGAFGMEQQSLAILALYDAYSKAENDPQREAMLDLIETKLLLPEEGEPNAAEYAKVLAEVKGKLPK